MSEFIYFLVRLMSELLIMLSSSPILKEKWNIKNNGTSNDWMLDIISNKNVSVHLLFIKSK